MQQTQTFLQVIGEALAVGQSAGIEVQGMGDGKVRLVFTPKIGETPEGASEELVALRAAIAAPFVVTGTAAEIEQAFTQRMQEKAAVLTRGMNALDEIDRLSSAAKEKAAGKNTASGSPAPTAQARSDDNPAAKPEPSADAAAPSADAPGSVVTEGTVATFF